MAARSTMTFRRFLVSDRESRKCLVPYGVISGDGLEQLAYRKAKIDRTCARLISKPPPKGLLIDFLMSPDRAEETLVNLLGRYGSRSTAAGRLGGFSLPSP